jgi:uncharacterized membrane protein
MPTELFLPLKLLHILSVIVAVGANVTYQAWLGYAGQDPTRLTFAIEGIRRLDRSIANPAYVLVLITGVLMVLTGQYSFETGWIAAAIALYVLVALLGVAVFAPAIRRQLQLAPTPTSPEYQAVAQRTRFLGWFTTVIVFIIVWLMVIKPF